LLGQEAADRRAVSVASYASNQKGKQTMKVDTQSVAMIMMATKYNNNNNNNNKELMYRDTTNVEPEMYDYTSNN